MNIFFLHQNAVIAARCLVDRHVVKMLLESCQMLSTAHRILDGNENYQFPNDRDKEILIYKVTHKNHPCSIWCRESIENYSWLSRHAMALDQEYTHRYNKVHKCRYLLDTYLRKPPVNIKQGSLTPFPCAMDDVYKISDDPIINYRNYYKVGKAHLHKWTNCNKPEWI